MPRARLLAPEAREHLGHAAGRELLHHLLHLLELSEQRVDLPHRGAAAFGDAREPVLKADTASPLIASATCWLMSARQGEVWQTTVDNAVALRALSDELQGWGELGGRYTYAAVLRDNAWGRGR
jgi:hypothetical protein